MPPLGADGCRGGWIGVLLDGTTRGAAARAIFAESLAALLAAAPGALAAVDCPIGLPDDWREPRPAEASARAFLAWRNARRFRGVGSRVFPAPPRPALDLWRGGAGYAEINRASDGKRLTRQSFHIMRTIAEADGLARGDGSGRIFESHPELAFARAAGETLARKKSAEGRRAREALLAALGFDLHRLRAGLGAARGRWAADDLLDACILADVARCRLRGAAERLPADPRPDSQGLQMGIWF